jgi:LmbE family N-acetylglucosaminyl deacetylase
MPKTAMVVALLLTGFALQAQQRPRVLLAIFAHPDDETIVGPALARYSREGIKVYVALATDGQSGTQHTKIPAGEELGKVRREEARCSCRVLGIEPPIFFGMNNDQLIAKTEHTRDYLMPLIQEIRRVMADLKPDAVITHGPEGGYGHSDHIAVFLAVTQVVQAGDGPERLFYAELPKQNLRAAAPYNTDPEWVVYRPTDERYLTVRVPFEEQGTCVPMIAQWSATNRNSH